MIKLERSPATGASGARRRRAARSRAAAEGCKTWSRVATLGPFPESVRCLRPRASCSGLEEDPGSAPSVIDATSPSSQVMRPTRRNGSYKGVWSRLSYVDCVRGCGVKSFFLLASVLQAAS